MKSKIEAFVNNNTLINYFEKNKIKVRLYIDSRDVISILGGLRELMNDVRGLDVNLYKSEVTKIYSLIYGGWLKKVYITIPHQDELLNHISNTFIFRKAGKIENSDIDDFWNSVLSHTTGLGQTELKRNLSIDQYIAKIKPNAAELYKANYLLRETDWPNRFKHLDSKALEFDKNEENIGELINSELFNSIYHSFLLKRPGKNFSRNNITDALTLCIINNRIQLFRQEKIDYLPVFYDSTNLFQEILHMSDTVDDFSISVDGKSFCLIRDSAYLQYAALFQNLTSIEALIGKNSSEDFAIYNHLINLLRDKEAITGKLHEYGSLIDKFTESRFLEVCWVNSDEKIHQFIKSLLDSTNQALRGEESKKAIREDVDGILNKMRDRVEDFSLYREIFERVQQAHASLRQQFTTNLGKYYEKEHDLDVMNVFSLVRFSICIDHCEDVNNLIKDLVFRDSHSSKTQIIAHIVQQVINSMQSQSRKDIIVPLMALWVLGELALIKRVLDRLRGKYEHFSEMLLHGAAISKTSVHPDMIIRLYSMLDSINDDPDLCFNNNYETAICASYIYFNLWLKKFDAHFLATLKEPELTGNQMVDSLLKQAIRLAKKAISLTRDEVLHNETDPYMRSKHYYIMNNYIYYITIGGRNAVFDEIKEIVGEFINAEDSNRELWQFRYHDTLALYHFRKAMREKTKGNEELYRFFLIQAKDRIKSALEWVISIEDESVYKKLELKITEMCLEAGIK